MISSEKLSKKQRKQLAKTTPLNNKLVKKQTIKHILANPYKPYWPVLDEDDTQLLNTVLKENLTILSYNTNIKYSLIKDVPKDKRKETRKKITEESKQSSEIPIDKALKEKVLFGINEVTKGLEGKTISAILISDDVSPQFMVNHIVQLSMKHKIPLLIVNNLRETLNQLTRISSVIFGVGKTYSEYNKTKRIYDCIYKLSNDVKYKVSKDNYPEIQEKVEIVEIEAKKVELKQIDVCKDIYLYKNGKNRIFQPELSIKIPEKVTNSLDYIGFNDTTVVEDEIYIPLKVKRVKNQTDRNNSKKLKKK